MREILFRAKTFDTKEWAYGYACKTTDGDWTLTDDVYLTKDSCNENIYTSNVLNINNEIIEQFTGLTDNTKWEQLTKEEQLDWLKNHTVDEWNGKKIFEGNIIKAVEVATFNPNPMAETCFVHFHKGAFVFTPVRFFGVKHIPNYQFTQLAGNHYITVIGDIHDNQELLNGNG